MDVSSFFFLDLVHTPKKFPTIFSLKLNIHDLFVLANPTYQGEKNKQKITKTKPPNLMQREK